MPAANVEVLHGPREFYDFLRNAISDAKERISISSLYLGCDELSRQLVHDIADSCRQSPSLQVRFVFDGNRGRRGGRGGESTEMLLHPLGMEFASRVRANFFKMPATSPFLKFVEQRLPSRFNEMFQTYHAKAYVFDDLLIMSGANLSAEYFTDRQDRYIILRDTSLANFYHSFVSTVARHDSRSPQTLRRSAHMFSPTEEDSGYRPMSATSLAVFPTLQFPTTGHSHR